MSLHAKLRAHKAALAAPPVPEMVDAAEQAILERQSLPILKKIKSAPTAAKWNPKRSRGRPRKQFPAYLLQSHPIAEWVRAALCESPDSFEHIGSVATKVVQTTEGQSVKVACQYPRLTLVESYLRFAAEIGHVVLVPKNFTAVVIKSCLEAGWSVRQCRTADRRRAALKGVCLKGQQPWNGEDRLLLGQDRKRWIAKH